MISKKQLNGIWYGSALLVPPPPKKKKNIRPTCKYAKYQLLNDCRYNHGARTPPLMQSSYILTKPKMNFRWTKGNNSWGIEKDIMDQVS